MFSPTRRVSRQKIVGFFSLAISRQFRLVHDVFSEFTIGWKRSLHLRNEAR